MQGKCDKNIFKPFYKKVRLLGLGGIVWLVNACTIEVPSEVIQPKEMENLLYDYHLMQAMSGELTSAEKYQRKLYEEYVFDKHHVTEAKFDSSLAWYMRNTKELSEIYESLNKRLLKDKEYWSALVVPGERIHETSQPGDTVNLWNDSRLYRLDETEFSNKLTFQIPADSNFHARDSFVWSLKIVPAGDIQNKSTMSMSLLYDNDSAVGTSQDITVPGDYFLTLSSDSLPKLKEIVGYLYVHRNDTIGKNDSISKEADNTLLLVSEISLMRYHLKDSVKVMQIENAELPDDSISIKNEK